MSKRESKKPHGPSYSQRRRCPFCGYIVNDTRRFTWNHKLQTFEVQYGSLKGQKGRGRIVYREVPDDEYESLMVEQLTRLAARLGYALVKEGDR